MFVQYIITTFLSTFLSTFLNISEVICARSLERVLVLIPLSGWSFILLLK